MGADVGTLAYIDESGDESPEVGKEGVTSHFVCVAVLVSEQHVKAVSEGVLGIEHNHNGGRVLKSSDIGGNHVRRRKVLSEAVNSEFTYVGLAVDKARLGKDTGLRYKKSFRKYFLRRLLERLYSGFGASKVVIDQHGSPGFQRSFKAYVDEHFPTNLFQQGLPMEFKDTPSTPGLRLVDWISGTIRILIEQGTSDNDLLLCRQALRAREIGLDLWPPHEMPNTPSECASAEEDHVLRDFMLTRAQKFAEEHGESEDPDRRAQSELVRVLLAEQVLEDPEARSSYLTSELIRTIGFRGFQVGSERVFRKKILGPVRDAGIFLAGSSNGMRIATCMADIEDYFDHVQSVVLPMLGRLSKCRQDLRLHSGIGDDPLEHATRSALKSLVESLGDQAMR